MGKSRRNSSENMFSNKGSVQAQKKEIVVDDIQISKEINREDIEVVTSNENETNTHAEEEIEVFSGEVLDKTEIKESVSLKVDNLFTNTKKERGRQQTIYFQKKVYDYCNGIAEKHEIGISDVVNKLILTIMEEE